MWLGIALAAYVALVVFFETVLLGSLRPELRRTGVPTLVLTTFDESGAPHPRRLAPLELDDRIYVSAHHGTRGGYSRALGNRRVRVAIEDTEADFLAVPVEGEQAERVVSAYPTPLLIRVLMGFPPWRNVLRPDPVGWQPGPERQGGRRGRARPAAPQTAKADRVRAPLYSHRPDEIFHPATLEDPQELYAQLRARTPVARIGGTGAHLVATWDLIDEILSREADFSANLTGVLMRGPGGEPRIFELPPMSEEMDALATADGPRHALHRAAVQPRFAAPLVAALEPRIRGWARSAIRAWLEGGAGDFAPVAEIVPARVVGELLGLPEGDASRFRTWAMIGGELLAGNVDEARLVDLAAEAGRMGDYLARHLDRALAEPRTESGAPLIHFLARAVKEGRLARAAALVIATTLFSAGGESTAALLGSLARTLSLRPDLASALRRDPALIPRFVEEVLRLESPFNFHYRLVRRPCGLAGFSLDPGDRLLLLWASANRDPARFEDPDRLRLDRRHPKNHLAFGRGTHFCIGARIARLEGRVLCEELLAATRSLAPARSARPVWANSIMVRRLERLPLEADPAG